MLRNIEIHDLRTPALLRALLDITEQTSKNITEEGKAFIRQNYWTETAELAQEKTNVTKVISWHFSVCFRTLGYHPDQVFFIKTGISQPSATLHIDNSHDAAITT
ncbi:hypothetical protein F5Y09DRAFT_342170 [Xylaria sp. FL1042]|nr:hypothetical protein F5Y09DRAFT_342170 [Xylaria sp. FL1042]